MPEVPRRTENVRIADFYERRVARFGVSPHALDWGSRYSQEKRFEVLIEVDELSGHSVLDVGCGQADLFAFLDSRGIAAAYTGYDISPAVIESARRRFPGLELELVDLMAEHVAYPQFDYVVASGIFHLRPRGGYAYLESMVRQMYRCCRLGVAFNSLSSKSQQIDADKFVADPATVLDMCFDITTNVVVRHDYMPHDFTVYLYRDAK